MYIIRKRRQRTLNYHEKYRDFYNSPAWKALRNYKFGAADGLCERCLAKGIVRAAREIHHIVPIEIDYSKRLDYDNLIALCSDCHNKIHNRQSPLQNFLDFWENM